MASSLQVLPKFYMTIFILQNWQKNVIIIMNFDRLFLAQFAVVYLLKSTNFAPFLHYTLISVFCHYCIL